jgi:hypothetical protein
MYSAGKVSKLIATPFNEAAATFSRDGRFIAFEADDGGVSYIYMQPFPVPGPRTSRSKRVIRRGGVATADSCFYWSGARLMEVAVQTRPVLHVGQSKAILEDRSRRGYVDVAPDGQRFLTFTPRSKEGPPELRIVLNWFEELERLAPHPH